MAPCIGRPGRQALSVRVQPGGVLLALVWGRVARVGVHGEVPGLDGEQGPFDFASWLARHCAEARLAGGQDLDAGTVAELQAIAETEEVEVGEHRGKEYTMRGLRVEVPGSRPLSALLDG